MAGLGRMAEEAGAQDGAGDRRARSRQGQAQGDRGRAGPLRPRTVTLAHPARRGPTSGRRWRRCNGERRWPIRSIATTCSPTRTRLFYRPNSSHRWQCFRCRRRRRCRWASPSCSSTSEQAELDGLFVDPDHWRRGIGTALVNEAVHRARRLGLALSVIAGAEARAFYESCGFSVEGEAQTRFGPALRMTR